MPEPVYSRDSGSLRAVAAGCFGSVALPSLRFHGGTVPGPKCDWRRVDVLLVTVAGLSRCPVRITRKEAVMKPAPRLPLRGKSQFAEVW